MKYPFLGLAFESLELSRRGPLAEFLAGHQQPLSGYTFASLASWDPFFQYGWNFAETGTLLGCRGFTVRHYAHQWNFFRSENGFDGIFQFERIQSLKLLLV